MHTQRQLFDLACQRNGFNYSQLADALGFSREHISKLKYGIPISDTASLRLADLCALDRAYVLACIAHGAAERLGKTDVLPVWSKIAAIVEAAGKTKGAAALAVAVVALFLMHSKPVAAASCSAFLMGQSIPYAKYAAVTLWRNWRALAHTLTAAAIIAAPAAQAGDWSHLNIAEESAFQALNLADWGTTLDIARKNRENGPRIFSESQSAYLIGAHPSNARIAELMGASALLHFAVSEALIRTGHPRLEHLWQAVTIADKADCVVGNFSIGLHIAF